MDITYRRETTFVTQSLVVLLRGAGHSYPTDSTKMIDCAGDVTLLQRSCVAVIGSRRVSREGYFRARKLGRQLADAGVVIVSGLAEGVDTAALDAAIEAKGRVIGVIGTPINEVFPAFNRQLQETIAGDHLLLSEFAAGTPTRKTNFPERNRTMAALSDATVIVEATDTSGTLHQARECLRLGRWLFILQSVLETPGVTWPGQFTGKDRVVVVSSTEDVLGRL